MLFSSPSAGDWNVAESGEEVPVGGMFCCELDGSMVDEDNTGKISTYCLNYIIITERGCYDRLSCDIAFGSCRIFCTFYQMIMIL